MTVALDSIPVSSDIRVEGEARKMEADANTPTCMLCLGVINNFDAQQSAL